MDLGLSRRRKGQTFFFFSTFLSLSHIKCFLIFPLSPKLVITQQTIQFKLCTRDYITTMYNYRRRQWQPTPVFLPGKSHGQRSLVGCSPWGCKESDTTEWLHFHFSLSCIEGNGSPLQCSCLENPRDGRVWWAAIYGVAQSRTRLKRLSSSSSSNVESDTVHGKLSGRQFSNFL